MKINKKLANWTKIVSIFLAILVTFGVLIVTRKNGENLLVVNAASNYARASALSYAENHWNDGKGLCAEFVSDCLKTGGMSSYSVSSTSLMSQLKSNAEGTVYQLATYGNKIRLSDNIGKVSAGDPIFWYCSNCGKYMHTALCNGASSAGNLVNYAHNGAQNGKSEVYIGSCYNCGRAYSAMYSVHMHTSQTELEITASGAYMLDSENLLVWGIPSDDNVLSSVKIATWTNNDSSVIWRDAVNNGSGTYFVTFPLSDYGNADIYYSHIYVYDYDGNYKSTEVVYYNDAIPPTVVESGAYMLDSENLLVWGIPNDNIAISSVSVATWTNKNSAVIWRDAVNNGSGTYFVTFPLSDYEEADVYYSHIYAYDVAGNYTSVQVEFYPDKTGPIISDIQITELSKDGYRITCHVEDVSGVKNVKFPTWRVGGDIIWHEGELNGNTATYYVKSSDHGNIEGVFHTHIYAYDLYDNITNTSATGSDIDGVYVDKTNPKIVSCEVLNVTKQSYTITAKYTDNYKVKKVSLATWSDQNQADIVWHDIDIINGTASWTLDATNCKNSDNCFWNDIYVWDECENTAINSIKVNIPVSSASVTLNQSSANVKLGDTFSLKATVLPSDSSDTVVWKSSNTNVATVTSNGQVKAVGVGTAVITATAGDVSASCTVTVERTVKITKSAVTLTATSSNRNPTVTLTAQISGSTVGKTWYSDNTAVATVNSSGKVTAVGDGTAKIYCKTADGITSDPCVVTVVSLIIRSEKAANTINNVVYVTENGTCKLLIPAISSGVTWKSSNAKIASIGSTTGVVKGVKKGTVTITATASDGTKDTVKLTVVKPTTSISLKSSAVNIYLNGTTTLKATLSSGSTDIVTWSSSNTSVATVTSKGVVKGLKQGTATITAKTFSGKSVSAKVTVRTRATAVAFEKTTSAVLAGGQTGTFTAKITAPAGCNDSITWTSNSKSIATVTPSNDGRTAAVKGLKKGTATITAKTGSGKKVSYKVTVVNTPAQSIKLSSSKVNLYTGASATLKAQVTPKTSNDLITWRSSNSSIVTVDQKGKIKGLKQGTATIYATTAFGQKQAVAEVTVRTKAKSITVNQKSVSVKKGATVTLSVSAITPSGCNDTLTWTTSSKAVAGVQASANGKTAVVTGLKKGTATITVKTGSGKSQKIKVTVTN